MLGMRSPFINARVVLLIPLLWLWVASWAFAGSKARAVYARTTTNGSGSLPDYYGAPVAKLGTPEKNVEVFMVSAPERSQWTYVVVMSEGDNIEQRYGDEQTVGQLLHGLSKDLHVAMRNKNTLRCPASSSWAFESPTGHVSYCSRTADATRIERAISLLELAPTE